jgi:hypothetical protein
MGRAVAERLEGASWTGSAGNKEDAHELMETTKQTLHWCKEDWMVPNLC